MLNESGPLLITLTLQLRRMARVCERFLKRYDSGAKLVSFGRKTNGVRGRGERARSKRLLESRDARRASPAASIQAPVLGKKRVDSFPTRNPDVATSPRLLSSPEFPLAQQRSDRLRAGS